MKRAIFLDRDGVINRKGGPYYIYFKEDFVLNKECLKHLNTLLIKVFF